MAEQNVWFDVTDSLSYPRPRLTGIQRVELETARQFVTLSNVRFIRYDNHRRCLVDVERSDLERRFDQLTSESAAAKHAPRRLGTPGALRRLRTSGRTWAVSPQRGDATRALLAARDDARRLVADVVRFALISARSLSRTRRPTAPCASTRWQPGDVVCSLGASDSELLPYLTGAIANRQVRAALTIYDLIPAVRPQFTGFTNSQGRDLIRGRLSTPSVIMAISASTAADVAHFCRDERLPVPECRIIPMASTVLANAPLQPASLRTVGEFVLCVGTIEIRKNHHLLFDVWESMIAEADEAPIPTLVIAGSVGWLNTETLTRMRKTPGFDSHIVFVENPTDSELAWLYRNCAFTVYPSFYEGWGLPVTESLDAGKVCLTSNVSSMPEAAEGLGILLDPTDRRAWKAEIVGLLADHDRRRGLEAAIAMHHVVRTPADVSSSVWAVVNELLAAPS